ncbi:MAG TPA: type IV pilin protein [Casimicrobiaceae bacterium]|nr:type IV pilin protein [Casimicrobiaceae bacterium]
MRKRLTFSNFVIALAVAAIFAAIALPSYAAYARKSARADAMSFIVDAAFREQAHFATREAYAASLTTLGVAVPPALADKYAFAVVATQAPKPAFTIRGTAVGDQANDACPVLTVDSAGRRWPSSCW